MTGKVGASDSGAIDYYKQSNALLADLIMNYRTVISFGPKNITFLMEKYASLLVIPNKQGIKMAHMAGIGFGYSFFVRFLFLGVIFYIAILMIRRFNLPLEDTFVGVFVLFMSALGAGQHAS